MRAILCPTEEIAERVGKLIGNTCYMHHKEYKEQFCLSEDMDKYCYKEWFIENGYDIITADEFLAIDNTLIFN